MVVTDRVSPFTIKKEGGILIVLWENGYLIRPLPLIPTEDNLLWLIKVGVLRREVDGQGITDSFRLTPLGHRLIESFQLEDAFPVPRTIDRLYNFWVQLLPIG